MKMVADSSDEDDVSNTDAISDNFIDVLRHEDPKLKYAE